MGIRSSRCPDSGHQKQMSGERGIHRGRRRSGERGYRTLQAGGGILGSVHLGSN